MILAGLRLKESAEERCRFFRETDDLVGGLTIEFEIEFGPWPAVCPVGQVFEFAPPQRLLGESRASDGDAHARRLSGDAALPGDRCGGGDDAPGDQALAAFIFAREHENRITKGDTLAAIHRLLRHECECRGARIANLGFDGERHTQ